MEPHETRYSSRLSPSDSTLRLRQRLPNSLNDEGRNVARRNLLELPPVLHRQAKISGHRRPRRALPKEIRRRRSQIQRRQEVKCGTGISACPLLLDGRSHPLHHPFSQPRRGAQHCCAPSTTKFSNTSIAPLFSVPSAPSVLNSFA